MLSEVIFASLFVYGIGAISALTLTLASKYMKIADDEAFENIRNILPGINCGACGFSGCDGYAAALAKGSAEPNLCTPGGERVKSELSKLLGNGSQEEVKRLRAFVACIGGEANAVCNADYQGYPSCKAASLCGGGALQCKYGCLGFGDCAKVCPTNAIKIEGALAVVDESLCIGCRKCVNACPKGIIAMAGYGENVRIRCSSKDTGALTRNGCKRGCIACGKCEKICPTSAIKIVDNLSVIDYKKCISCTECVKTCPVKCIEDAGCI